MKSDEVIIALRKRSTEAQACVEVGGKRYAITGVETDGAEKNGVKITTGDEIVVVPPKKDKSEKTDKGTGGENPPAQ